MEKITSRDNKLIKLIKKLSEDKKNRDSTNLFVVETIKVVDDLIKQGIKCQNILFSNEKLRQKILGYSDVLSYETTQNIIESISSLKSPDGIIAIFVKPKLNFSIEANKKYIILNNIQNPGNVGTIIRTASAFDVAGVILCNSSSDIYNPVLIRSSMGAVFSTPIMVVTSLSDIIKKLKAEKFTIYASALDKTAMPINEVVFERSSAVVLGSEGKGLCVDDIKLCDKTVYIPITKVDSLNVSSAATILIYKLMV
jgi:TrmH family RNA methyltransferase